jgi:hypothetical protein
MKQVYHWRVYATSPTLGEIIFQSGRAPSRDEALEIALRYYNLYPSAELSLTITNES